MDQKQYGGLTNASGAIAFDDQHFIVADDEDNQLCIYAKQHKKPRQTIALKKVFADEISKGKHQEADLEAAARLGDVFFWIGSHSTSRTGKSRPARHCLFALQVDDQGKADYQITPFGTIYRHLIADLSRDLRFQRYALAQAATIAPKAPGGLSIEGLAATPQQSLLIGLRNPLIDGKALLIELLNPLEVLNQHAPQFAHPLELDLAGLGIRDIVYRQDQQFLIVAGPYHANENRQEAHRLYLWDQSTHQLQSLTQIDLADWNIEAAFFYPDEMDTVHLLTDDGEKQGFLMVSVVINCAHEIGL